MFCVGEKAGMCVTRRGGWGSGAVAGGCQRCGEGLRTKLFSKSFQSPLGSRSDHNLFSFAAVSTSFNLLHGSSICSFLPFSLSISGWRLVIDWMGFGTLSCPVCSAHTAVELIDTGREETIRGGLLIMLICYCKLLSILSSPPSCNPCPNLIAR